MKKEASNSKMLHGNYAKIAPGKHVESLYQNCKVTLSDKEEQGTPVVSEENVAYAKAFVEENKK